MAPIPSSLAAKLKAWVTMDEGLTTEGVSAGASLVSLAWALAAYTRAMRRSQPGKTHVSWPGLVCQAVWRGGMVTARIATLVLFAVGFHAWLFLLIGLHWLGMTIWIVYQKTDFCLTPWEECIYNCVVGVIYCFCFFNLQEGHSRYHVLAFYTITIMQNISCLGLFLALAGITKPGLVEVAGVIIVGGTVLGVSSMLLYYRFFHPAGPIKLCSKQLHSVECGTPSHLTELNAEQTATLRSLKHCYTVSRLNGTSTQEGSPQSDDVCTDKNLLLTNWVSGQTTSPSEKEDLDSKQKRRGICCPLELGLDLGEEEGDNNTNQKSCALEQNNEEERKQKRRGICSSDALDLEFNKKGVKRGNAENETSDNKECVIFRILELNGEGGCVDSENDVKQTDVECDEVLSVPSEVLSAHDYENICAVNIAREAWGLRSWRGYRDIETWLHDDSVVHDRRRDTLTSTTTTLTSASSENSGGNGDSNTASPPPIPCRRPLPGSRLLRTRQDDYLDTLIDDLVDCELNTPDQNRPLAEFVAEERDSTMFVARPYVVDQHGTLFPLVTLDTIMEELEESSTENSEPLRHKQRHDSASTLVATIDEIRHGNLYNSTDALWDVHNDSVASCTSLLTTNHSRTHLSPEEILFLSQLQPLPDTKTESTPNSFPKSNPEVILDASPYLKSIQDDLFIDNLNASNEETGSTRKHPTNRPRRKFSLLREKFESKQSVANTEMMPQKVESSSELQLCVCPDDSKLNIACESESEPIVCFNKENIPNRIKQWNNFLKTQNSCNSKLSPVRIEVMKPSLKERRSMFLKQVLSPTWGKKNSLSPSTKVVPAS